MSKTKESKALREVWAMKAACWRDVAHLPLDQAIAKRLRDSTATAKRLGFLPDATRQGRVTRVAEKREEYVTQRRK